MSIKPTGHNIINNTNIPFIMLLLFQEHVNSNQRHLVHQKTEKTESSLNHFSREERVALGCIRILVEEQCRIGACIQKATYNGATAKV